MCCVGSHTGAFEGGDSQHKSFCALAIAWLGKIKQDWIQKAVHAGKWPGALVDDREEVFCFTGCTGNTTDHQVHSLGQVKGQETNTEHGCHHNDHPYRFVPFLLSCHGDTLVGNWTAKNLNHPTVTHHNAQKRYQEPQAGQGHAVGIVIYRVCGGAEVVAYCAVPLDSRCSEVKSRCTQGDDKQPHPSTDTPSHFRPTSLVPHYQRMANTNISLHTDAGEEEDTAMQVTVSKSNRQCTVFKNMNIQPV